MLAPNELNYLQILGSDTLREYRDEIIKILARRNVTSDDVVRNNVQVQLEHTTRELGGPTILKEFVLHPGETDCGTGVMINRDTTRDHLWIEARWVVMKQPLTPTGWRQQVELDSGNSGQFAPDTEACPVCDAVGPCALDPAGRPLVHTDVAVVR